MKIENNEKMVLEEVGKALEKKSKIRSKKLVEDISKRRKIFLAGGGRSGLVAEMFAIRLMQLGLNVYMVGESVTPRIMKKDLLIAISGSGKTTLTEKIVDVAKSNKAKIILITSNKKSPIAKKSNKIIEIKSKTKLNKFESIQPLGSLFENSTHVFLEAVVIELMNKLKINEEKMMENHSKIS